MAVRDRDNRLFPLAVASLGPRNGCFHHKNQTALSNQRDHVKRFKPKKLKRPKNQQKPAKLQITAVTEPQPSLDASPASST